MSLQYVVRPLTSVAWQVPPAKRVRSRFTATWGDTQNMLSREVRALHGRVLVIGVQCTEADLRIDGMLRANARLESPAVEVAFDTPEHGPLIYRCDRYHGGDTMLPWQHNVRAIALTLGALRDVSRHGAVHGSEQYRGFRQIGAQPHVGTVSEMDAEAAMDLLREVSQCDRTASVDTMWRTAMRWGHPDSPQGRLSVQDRWEQIREAGRVLGKVDHVGGSGR